MSLLFLAIAIFALVLFVTGWAALLIYDVLVYSYKGRDTTPPFEIPSRPEH